MVSFFIVLENRQNHIYWVKLSIVNKSRSIDEILEISFTLYVPFEFVLVSKLFRKFLAKVEKYARRNFRIDFVESAVITESKLRRLCSRSVSVHGLYEGNQLSSCES